MSYEPQPDFGTPASYEERQVTLSIDGRETSVPAGTTVMLDKPSLRFVKGG